MKIYSVEDHYDPPISKLVFLILEDAYFENFDEIHLFYTSDGEKNTWFEFLEEEGLNPKKMGLFFGHVNVYHIRGDVEKLYMTLQPECMPSIREIFKKVTNWRNDIPHLNQESHGKVQLSDRKGEKKVVVEIEFSIKEVIDPEFGEGSRFPYFNCFIKFVKANSTDDNGV